MVETGSKYVIAWGVYLLAVMAAQLLCWRVTRVVPWADLRAVIQLSVFAVLMTAVRLEPSQNYWVPAFMAAIMDGLTYGADQAVSRLWPILFTLLALLLLSVAWSLFKWRRRRAEKSAPGSG